MKKSIYKITNLINNKIYIGQSVSPYKRFAQHCINHGVKGGKNSDTSLINLAIRKYGKENFSFEIIEEDIENYNEREKYWISYYNSKKPYGYNISDGGEEPPHKIGEDNPNSNHTKEEVEEIKYLLEFSDLSIKEIAQMYGYYGHSTVGFINSGKNWHDKDRVYPIRDTKCSKNLSLQKINNIIDDLLNTKNTQEEIAKKYNIGRHVVTAINLGNSYKQHYLQYPLRASGKKKKTLEQKQIDEIIELIIQNVDSLTEIADKYDVSVATISNIKNGKSHKKENLIYPLR